MDVRLAFDDDRSRAVGILIDVWGDPIIVRGQTYRIGDCEIFIAGKMAGLAAISVRDKPIAELVAINAFDRHQGIGTALIKSIPPAITGCDQLRLTTTNDNLDAIRFYQRRGFHLTALRAGAVDAARLHKPSIPTIGEYGIPLRDELDLTMDL